MELPIVQILLKDRVLQQVPFRGESLRIGRMKENDIVVNNLAVSRFHATLHRSGDGVELEDLGSENGCYLNGARVRGRVRLAQGDRVRIGKHELLWDTHDGASDAPAAPAHGPSDAWDAAQTYFTPMPDDAGMGAPSDAAASAPTSPPVEAQPREPAPGESPTDLEIPGIAARAAEAELDLAAEGPELALAGADSEIDPEAEGLDLDGGGALDDALALDDPDDSAGADFPAMADEGVPLEAEADEPGADLGLADDALEEALETAEEPAAATPGDDAEEALFDFGADAELGASDPGMPADTDDEPAAEPAEEPAGTGEPPVALEPEAAGDLVAGRYPGLILQRGGRLERVVAWEETHVAAALDDAGDLRLGPDAAPARAVFVREGDRFRVRAESEELAVNGEPVMERVLEVGDVVGLGEWKLTFVLDHEPVQNEVLSAPEASPEAALTEPPTVEMGVPRLDAEDGDAASPSEPASAEVDLLAEPEEDEEKELPVTVRTGGQRGPEAVATGPMSPLLVEVELRPEDLPAPLRALVDALEGGEVSVPVRLRLRAGRPQEA